MVFLASYSCKLIQICEFFNYSIVLSLNLRMLLWCSSVCFPIAWMVSSFSLQLLIAISFSSQFCFQSRETLSLSSSTFFWVPVSIIFSKQARFYGFSSCAMRPVKPSLLLLSSLKLGVVLYCSEDECISLLSCSFSSARYWHLALSFSMSQLLLLSSFSFFQVMIFQRMAYLCLSSLMVFSQEMVSLFFQYSSLWMVLLSSQFSFLSAKLLSSSSKMESSSMLLSYPNT